jgi:predicted AAA+ superfamily ATPase
MVHRELQTYLLEVSTRYPVVTVTGPRQSGKTTLCKFAFPGKPYVSLEPPDQREFAIRDPRGFLARFPEGAIIDEIQRASSLLSYIQEKVDEDASPGRYVLTGSQNLGLLAGVTQTLAGRTVLLTLLPLNLAEVSRFPSPPQQLDAVLWTGGYPRIFDRNLPPAEWLASYVATYVERDVRQVLDIGDLLAFQTFLRMCAGRVGQLLNLSGLGADCGVTHATARSWISVMETTYIAFRLPPWHVNIGKRLIKTPKLYFYDTGLLCYLLGIRTPEQLEVHPLRGSIFECWVASEILKHELNRGVTPQLFFFRDRSGDEVDFILDRGVDILAMEVKAGQTFSSDYFYGIDRLRRYLSAPRLTPRPCEAVVIYGGMEAQTRTQGRLQPWAALMSNSWLGNSSSV